MVLQSLCFPFKVLEHQGQKKLKYVEKKDTVYISVSEASVRKRILVRPGRGVNLGDAFVDMILSCDWPLRKNNAECRGCAIAFFFSFLFYCEGCGFQFDFRAQTNKTMISDASIIK